MINIKREGRGKVIQEKKHYRKVQRPKGKPKSKVKDKKNTSERKQGREELDSIGDTISHHYIIEYGDIKQRRHHHSTRSGCWCVCLYVYV